MEFYYFFLMRQKILRIIQCVFFCVNTHLYWHIVTYWSKIVYYEFLTHEPKHQIIFCLFLKYIFKNNYMCYNKSHSFAFIFKLDSKVKLGKTWDIFKMVLHIVISSKTSFFLYSSARTFEDEPFSWFFWYFLCFCGWISHCLILSF